VRKSEASVMPMAVNHRAREPAGDGEAAREGRAQVARAQRHQLLVGLDALAPLGRQRLPDRHRLDKPHHADEQRGHQQRLPEAQVEQRQGQRGQALRHRAHDLHALALPLQRPCEQSRDHDGRHRPGRGNHVGRAGLKADAHEQGLEAAAHPEQKCHGGHTDAQCEQVGAAQLRDQRLS
jgi:hypothetical protein